MSRGDWACRPRVDMVVRGSSTMHFHGCATSWRFRLRTLDLALVPRPTRRDHKKLAVGIEV